MEYRKLATSLMCIYIHQCLGCLFVACCQADLLLICMPFMPSSLANQWPVMLFWCTAFLLSTCQLNHVCAACLSSTFCYSGCLLSSRTTAKTTKALFKPDHELGNCEASLGPPNLFVLSRMAVLNDFEACGYGVPALQAEDLFVLNDVPARQKVSTPSSQYRKTACILLRHGLHTTQPCNSGVDIVPDFYRIDFFCHSVLTHADQLATICHNIPAGAHNAMLAAA